jgi:uncharacterized membrane protein YgdD (TMEM256/DUF423 family)
MLSVGPDQTPETILNRTLLVIGALFGLTAVLLGAFGAHGLQDHVSAQRLAVWETGAHYLGWHATTVLAVVALLAVQRPPRLRPGLLRLSAWAMVVGCVLFSGSLFALVLTDTPAWGAVTPIGGLSFAVGWGALALSALWTNADPADAP